MVVTRADARSSGEIVTTAVMPIVATSADMAVMRIVVVTGIVVTTGIVDRAMARAAGLSGSNR